MTQTLCIDEKIVPFKGDSSIRQYIKKCHINGGINLLSWLTVIEWHDFLPYTGKIESVNDPNVLDLKASSNSVFYLVF